MSKDQTGGLVILGGGAQQVALIELANQRGLHTTVLEPNPEAPGRAVADRFVVVDLADWNGCHHAVEAAAPRGIATFAADFPIPMLARLCATFGLPGVRPETAQAATDKAVMRSVFDDNGVPRPEWRAASDLTSARAARELLGGHVIVKPARSSGSRGVSEIGHADDDDVFRLAVLEVLDIGDTVLVESVADGPEVSVETVTIDGRTTVLAVTDKITTGPPEFVEIGHSQPSSFVGSDLAAVHEAAVAAIGAIGLTDGIGHTEIRVGGGGPSVIEVAARAGGGYIMSRLLPLTTGVNAVSLTIDLALGKAVVPQLDERGGAAVRFIEAPPGTVCSVDGEAAAARTPGVVEVVVELAPGHEVRPLRDARDRIGHVVATGDDSSLAAERARCAATAICVAVATGERVS